ncbi:Uncharacterised protein [Mycobacterium tuberculosis]|nr:Uncharacterised protein [Mycobacterium tuberculosis]
MFLCQLVNELRFVNPARFHQFDINQISGAIAQYRQCLSR